MILYAVIGVAAFAFVVLLGSLVARAARTDDVEKFHRARELTTEWARHYSMAADRPSVDID